MVLYTSLASYRVYRVSGAGRIDRLGWAFSAGDDEQAERQAQALSDGETVELWAGARRVARLNDSKRRLGFLWR